MKNRYYDTIFWKLYNDYKQSNHQISKINVDITVNCSQEENMKFMRYNGKIAALVMILRTSWEICYTIFKIRDIFFLNCSSKIGVMIQKYQISILREIYFSLTWDKNILILFLLLKYLPSRLHQYESPTYRKELFHENRNRKLVDQLHALPPFLKRTFFPLTDLLQSSRGGLWYFPEGAGGE